MEDLLKSSPERLEEALGKLYRWEWDELLGEEPKDATAWEAQRAAAISLLEEQFGPVTRNWLWNKYGLGRSFPEWAAWRRALRDMELKQSNWSIFDGLATALDILIPLAALVATLWILLKI